ncbi:MAG: MarR family transcriptional regulator [Thermoplasmata archaeon]|nr:MarR family transcriptional regulator [Thermoplasmata archaeon]
MVATAALARRDASPGDADQLVAAVHGVMQSVLRRSHPALEAEGITMGQFWAMHLVSSLQSASLTTVARYLSVSAPTVCAKVDDLERAGLLTRQRSVRDRRAVVLTLTPKGRRVEARLWGRIGRMMADAAAELPAEDVTTAVRVFRELNRHLDATGGRPGVGA